MEFMKLFMFQNVQYVYEILNDLPVINYNQLGLQLDTDCTSVSQSWTIANPVAFTHVFSIMSLNSQMSLEV